MQVREMAICNAEPGSEKKRKKKQKRRGNACKGDHRGCDPSEGNGSNDSTVPQGSPVKICLNLEPEGGQSHSEVILLKEKNEKGWKKHNDLQYGETSGISVLNILNVKLIKKDETSVSPNSELCSVDGKENSLVPEELDGKCRKMIKRDDGHIETLDHLAQPSQVDIQKTKKRKRHRKRRRSLESPKISLESNMEDGKKIALPGCLHEVETISHCKNCATVEVMNGVLSEEVSIHCPVSENPELCSANTKESSMVFANSHGSRDGENATMIGKDNDCLKYKDCLAQLRCDDTHGITKRERKKSRKKRKFADSLNGSLECDMEDGKTGAQFNCSNEMETTSLHEHSTIAERVKNVLLEEVSIDCSVSENRELCSANTKESSVVFADFHGSLDCESAMMIEKDNDCLKTKDCLARLSCEDTHGKTKREQKKDRKKRKFADSLNGSLESDMEDGKTGAAFNCSNEVAITSLHEHSTTTKRVKNGLLEEVSIACSIVDLPSEIKEKVDMNFSCKIFEEEMKTKKQKGPHLLTYAAINNGVGSVQENNSYSQISVSSKERDAISCSKKKLLILDVNGLLVDFVPYFPEGYTPDIIISNKAVFKRPFCDDFLQFCFERFEVGVWSSRTWKNLNLLINFLMRDSKHKLLFCWDQSYCTNTRFTTIENNKKPLVLKELKKVWENLDPYLPWKKGEYDESNTLLLDDSPYKALRNPANTAVFPTSYRYKDSADTSLGPGGDIRVYLEGLSMAENVQKYVEQNPFGQKPISESNPSWKFYCKIINSEGER